MEQEIINLAKKTIWLRMAQILVNDRYKNDDFKVPVHLAMGHEAIAVAVDSVMQQDDVLLVTHRNAHYNLARQNSLKEELDEYYLREKGLAQGRLGSMNLSNPEKGIPYASSILGNNMPVACGYALGNRAKDIKAVTFVTTGDGAMEEGAFYESLLFMKSYNLPVVLIVENNDWSLATRIDERRAQINIGSLVDGFGIEYVSLNGNDVIEYGKQLSAIRARTIENNSPIVIEVKLTTLGYWYMADDYHSDGKFINYHCGPAPDVDLSLPEGYPIIDETDSDPLYVLNKYFSKEQLIEFSVKSLASLKVDIE